MNIFPYLILNLMGTTGRGCAEQYSKANENKTGIISSDQEDPCKEELKISQEGARACRQQSIESARSAQLKN
jgi:hypothetical protein